MKSSLNTCRGCGAALPARTCATAPVQPARATRRGWSPQSSCTMRPSARASSRCATLFMVRSALPTILVATQVLPVSCGGDLGGAQITCLLVAHQQDADCMKDVLLFLKA